MSSPALRARWLGRVRFGDAHALQRGLWQAGAGAGDWLLLLEHPHVFTLGVRGRPGHVLVDPASVGAELVRTDRGGDVTYHGPGQLVGYPVLDVPRAPGATPAYVAAVEQLLIDAVADLGMAGAGRLAGYPGVWVGAGGAHPRKVAAIGVRLSRGRSMHGFALNVDPDMGYFDSIVPCGLAGMAVTSLAAEGLAVGMAEVVDAVVARAAAAWGQRAVERQDVAWPGRGRVPAGELVRPAPAGELAGAAPAVAGDGAAPAGELAGAAPA
ncbi:MAG: lipoyl(octanoyl) transferase LipB, partial [Acidimicrobiales bacterium]